MNRAVDDPSLYFNREASWLAFNRRVLEEANDERNPLLERVKFLAITASNLDEFFEVRVAGLLQRIEDGYIDSGPDALTAQQERDLIATETHEFVQEQYACWNKKLLPAMAREFTAIFKALGFHYVTLDLEGYRQGSLNEQLNNRQS